ncbi:MAG: GTP 3',8-cyclase MoaA [Elusimicrobiota bacterium]|nr:MAG: GTP 3',8-cyclase MoaA [Elusimicrobiota bacterium]
MTLVDGFGRSFHYLRLSVEDACNFRCAYCLPNGYKKTEADAPLSTAEIGRLVKGFAGLGFWKVRLTGGEPTVRRDIVEIAAATAATPGIRKVALSTNGWNLASLAPALKSAGVSAVNVSIDSLDRSRFAGLTGSDSLDNVMAGVERSLELGFETKVNAVLMKGLNDTEFGDFVGLTKTRPLSVRFIELMPAADNADFFAERHLKAEALITWLQENGWRERARKEGDGPARNFMKDGHKGSVGVIAPYAKDFCSSCNRLRVTSRGKLRLCLFSEKDHSLRDLLQEDSQLGAMQDKVKDLLGLKEVSHYLPEGKIGNTKHFAMMGG